MALNFVQFTVDDTSPTISYSPFGDTFSTPNLSAGWNPYYTLSGFARALGDVGNGTSLHITSNNGSSLVIQWHGTAIQLWGNATSASFSTMLDGALFTPATPPANASILATIDGLEDAPHAVTLTALIPPTQNPPNSSILVFEKAIITSSPAANVTFEPQTIDDNDIAFLGRWSFETAPSGASFHTSQSYGDRAVTTFNGTTFLLQGVTSPQSGNYTVTVDNATTYLSGRSSFTTYNTLLFFASGLDNETTHSVVVENNGGGNLSLLVGGLNTVVPTIMSPLPVLTVTSDKSFPQGTIAAFALAGILAFVIISGLLFFLIYRPRRRRFLAESIRRIQKGHEAGVLDIGPDITKMPEASSPVLQQDSAKNGFTRWRRGAVEGSPGESSLPIHFRHSDSLDEKNLSPLNDVPRDDVSEGDSSAERKARAKRKGKARQITGRSWSPSITLELPHRWRSHRSHRQSSVLYPTSAVESLGYVSTFIAAEPTSPKNAAPPSYAVSVRDSNPSSHPSSNMPSVPRSVTPFPGEHEHSYPPQNQDNAGTFLLRSRESNSEPSSSASNSPHRLKPPEAIPLRSLSRDDRGSPVEGTLNVDNQSVMGAASLQQVIRSLSPRTVRHPYANRDSIQEPPSPQESNLQEDDAVLMTLPQISSNDDSKVEVRDGVFLSVRTPSPFHLNFDTSQVKPPSSDESNNALSYVTGSSSGKPSRRSSGLSNAVIESDVTRPLVLMPTNPDFVQGNSNTRFRLTPLSIPQNSPATAPTDSSNGNSGGVTSFLDLSISREPSLASRSIKTNWSEERRRSNLYPPMVEPKSRWSNTTVPSMKSKSSNIGSSGNSASRHSSSNGSQQVPSESQSRLSSTFPRLSLPPSVNIGPSRRSQTSGLIQTAENLHVHPPFEGLESPTESIPMSVSELRFRQSISEENAGLNFNSRRTTDSSLVFASSHRPPLPIPHGEFTPRPFDPSILVNRVLGLPSPVTSSTTTTRPTGYSSPPLAAPSPSSFALRQNTNNRGDHSNSETSGTDS